MVSFWSMVHGLARAHDCLQGMSASTAIAVTQIMHEDKSDTEAYRICINFAKHSKRKNIILIPHTAARLHSYCRDFCSHSKPCSKKSHAKLFDLADYPIEECCATTNPPAPWLLKRK